MKIALKNLRICSGFQILNQSKSYNLNASLMFSIMVILVDFYAKVNYWSYILHSSNTWEKKMGMHWGSASALYKLQESLWFG